jgi:hypothetical protein
MAIIWACSLSPSTYAAAGREVVVPAQSCPTCGRALIGWGGYWRWVRAADQWEQRIWIRRGWCPRCRHTQALLPSFLFVRRLDVSVVIGTGLEQAAGGRGARPIAAHLAVPHTTVRDWWRRLQVQAPWLLASLLALALRLDPAPVDLRRDGGAAVLEALAAAWQRAGRHLGAPPSDRWAFWSLMSGGLALAPHSRPPFPDGPGARLMRASP